MEKNCFYTVSECFRMQPRMERITNRKGIVSVKDGYTESL